MYGKVKIGEKEVGMLANAASPYIYKQVFGEDFLVEVQKPTPASDLFQKMAFVMAKQAETDKIAELMKVKLDGFYEWLGQFEPMDIMIATKEISELYFSQTKSMSVPKSEGG